MPDIAMCTDNECPQKNTCYRFRAIPNEFRQSYSHFGNRDKDNCEYYNKVLPSDRVTPIKSEEGDK